MENEDFSKLRHLLALQKRELPADTQVDQFLIEFHRRQRAQLLKPATSWTWTVAWLQERMAGFEGVPSLSWAAALTAVALTAVVGLSHQVQVTEEAGHSYKLSLSSHGNALAMLPGSLPAMVTSPLKAVHGASSALNRSNPATTRFVLANNSPRAYDSIVAF